MWLPLAGRSEEHPRPEGPLFWEICPPARHLQAAASEQSLTPTEVSVLLLDVDRFKQFNDAFGHPDGDAVLRKVASLLQSCIRDCDLAARYGGEEFLLVLPGCDLGCAAQQAERLRLAIGAEPMPLYEERMQDGINSTLPVSASFVATTYYPGTSTRLEALIKLADDALYEAKRTGRNRVCLHGQEKTPKPVARASTKG